ncbi:MAG: thioredoxin family protein [Methylovulum sp.]|nr:MAG: thioredoxin family protein [Methylovulum sp.]
MKKISLIIAFWMLGIAMASADIPKAGVSMTALNPGQWPAQYRITLTIPQDHHAYLNAGDKNIYIPVSFDAGGQLANAGLAIDQLQAPTGIYDDLVKAQVLREQGDYSLALKQTQAGLLNTKTIPLNVKYQLCNDLTHVCFRPQTAQVDLPLPPPGVIETADDEASQGVMDKLLMLFKDHQDNTMLIFGLMFIAGLLSVATPCVYPMLPITAMFIVNRANGVAEKEKQHALVYLAGIVGTYTLLGLIAGMTGGAFNTFMQSAWINLGFAVFFAFFALALLGFYELAFMQNEVYTLDQRSSQVKGLTGTWLMGTVAGLVISPCVGPIVFALLLQVADNIADKAAVLASANQHLTFWDRLGIASAGSVMMAGFGAGVGIPFFIVSVVKFKKLPKAGYWMNKIKYAFGFMILYFAYVYFNKGMGVLGVTPATTLALAIGMLAIWIAVVHCNVLTLLPQDAAPNQKIHHYCGLMSLIIGGWLVVAGLGQMPFIKNAEANIIAGNSQHITTGSASAIQEEAGIAWHRSYAAAQKLAAQTGKPVFIDFYASWCANCIAFKEETVHNKALNDALRNNAIAVKLVDNEPEFEKFRTHPEHRQLKIGLPYFAILTPDGLVAWSGTDYKATQKMVSILTHWAG